MTPFNAQQFDPTQSTGQLPVGKHPVKIIDSEVKANSANTGGYLQLTLQIIDGPQTGTTGAYRLNIYNQSQQAVDIAHRQLSAICHVIGVFNVQDSAQLHNIPFMVEVGLQKGEEKYTEVKKVFDIHGNEPGKTGQPAQNAAPANGFAQQQPNIQQQPQNQAPAWGGGQQAPVQQNQPSGAPAWGNQPAQNAAPQGNAGGWGGNQGGAAPWGNNQS